MPNDKRVERLKRTISILLFATFIFLTAIVSLCTMLLPSYSEYLEDVFEALTWVAEIFQPSTPFHRHRSPTPTQPPIVERPEELPPLVTRPPTPIPVYQGFVTINGDPYYVPHSHSPSITSERGEDSIYHIESPPTTQLASPASTNSHHVTAEEQQHGEQPGEESLPHDLDA